MENTFKCLNTKHIHTLLHVYTSYVCKKASCHLPLHIESWSWSS